AKVERRKHKRYSVVEGAFVALKPSDSGVGRLIDISMGGLTFDYVTMHLPSVKATELDLFVTNSTFRLFEIPIRSVWDLTTFDFPSSPLHKRRCGVEFGDLTSKQRLQIEHFIENYTADEVWV
ncbi:MAG: PilZ domain-containing protein, partial [Desulfobacteria bacterium]